MANVLAVVAFVLGIVIPASCLGVWTAVMLPQPVTRARNRIEARPLLCLAWGIFAVLVAFVVLVLILPQRDAGFRLSADVLTELTASTGLGRFSNDARILTHVCGWLALSPLMVAWVIGGAALSTLFADRVHPGAIGFSRFVAVATGSLCLHFSYFLPFIGWLIFLPVVGCLSIGAGIAVFNPWGRKAQSRQPDRPASQTTETSVGASA